MHHFKNFIDREVAILRHLGIPAETRGSLRYINLTINGQPQCWHMLNVGSSLAHLGYTEEQLFAALQAAVEELEWQECLDLADDAYEQSVCASYAARGQANLY